MMVEVGQPAPEFTLPGIENGVRHDYTLSEYRGRKVVLAFYPGDNTPGARAQMCSYRDDFAMFESVGAVLLGISPQDVDSHESWAKKRDLQFPLLADTEKKVIELYGVRGGKLIPVKRSVFVVGPDGPAGAAVDQHRSAGLHLHQVESPDGSLGRDTRRRRDGPVHRRRLLGVGLQDGELGDRIGPQSEDVVANRHIGHPLADLVDHPAASNPRYPGRRGVCPGHVPGAQSSSRRD